MSLVSIQNDQYLSNSVRSDQTKGLFKRFDPHWSTSIYARYHREQTVHRSISNNSIRQSKSLYQQPNENRKRQHNLAVIAYHRSSPIYQQNTNVQASPPFYTIEGWQTARGSTKVNRSNIRPQICRNDVSNAAVCHNSLSVLSVCCSLQR
jgi:hypothetical protein